MLSLFQRLRQELTHNNDNQASSALGNSQSDQPMAVVGNSPTDVEGVAAQGDSKVVFDQPESTHAEGQDEIVVSTSEQAIKDLTIQHETDQNEPVVEENLGAADEEVASTIPDEPQPKSFQRTTREAFALNQFMSEMPPILSTEMQYYRSVNTAIVIQTSFHNFALIVQGFLSGFALFHTIIALAFADVSALIKGYQYVVAPMHATFYFCFVISAIDAMDRFETGSTWRETLSRWIRLQRGGLGLLIAVCGTATTVIMTKFEEYLATNLNNESVPQTGLVNTWHWLSVVRAVCAMSGWLLIALQPSANFMRDQLLAMAPQARKTANVDAADLSSESERITNARVISSLANSVARLDLSQDFLTSIKVLAAHQAST